MANTENQTPEPTKEADIEVAEKPGDVTDGTLMRTFLQEKDWGHHSITLMRCWRPEICAIQIYVVAAMNFIVWFGLDMYLTLFKIRISEALVCLQESVMITPLVGVMGHTPRWLLLGPIFISGAVLVFLTDVIMVNRSIGIGIFAIGWMVAVRILNCKGKVTKPRARYFWALISWALFLQLLTFVFIKYALMPIVNGIASASNEFIGGLAFPLFGVIYGASSVQTLVCVDRRMKPVGASAACSYCQIWAIRCFATSMKIGGFIPKAGISQELVIAAMVGSFLTNFASGVSERTFFAQRLQSKLCGGGKKVVIKPEMDTYLRSKVSVSRAVIPYFLFTLALGIPAGGSWTKDIFAYLGPLVYLLSELLGEIVIIILHRVYVPIEGETFFGTRERLTKPFMHWPQLQADEGMAYKRAVAAAKGEVDNELDKIAKEDEDRMALAYPESSRWSSHPIFTDEVCACLYAFGCNIHMVALIFVLRYGECGIWVASGAVHEKYGSCVGW